MVTTERKTVRYASGKKDPRDPLHGTRYRTKVQGFSDDGEPIFKCIGEGGFSQVYEAESRNLETDAVVKVLKHQVADDRGTVDRILAEARNVAQLDHPNIVKVLDVGFTADKRAYIAMEKLCGRTLHDLLAERGRIAPFDAVVYTRQILAAMGYAHRRGIIHRDLKPDNVFLHYPDGERGSDACVKVIDFGLAKLLPRSDGLAKFRRLKETTLRGLFVGTPRYAAPEQFVTDELPVDQRADIYSIALILYRSIVGSDPFDLFSPDVMGDAKLQFTAQTLMEHLNSLAESQQAPDLKCLAAELPKNLDSILKKALERHPKLRYQHAEDLDGALQGIERVLLSRKPFSPGQSCGPYVISDLIARGHIGDVYLAQDEELRRPVAIKTLKVVQDTEREQRTLLESLRQQAAVLAHIKHPNLPTMYMAQETGGRYWMATELVMGRSLRDLRKRGPLEADAVVRYAIDIASGLDAAHAHGILHLDLKPSNVLVTESGRAVVIDLGMAQALYSQAPIDSDEVHGSSAYTAPELLKRRGHRAATARSDIYSLGIILYELLAEHPYRDVLDDAEALMHHHVFVEPAPLARRRRNLGEALCGIVACCLSKEPAHRFRGMAELVTALNRVLATGSREDTHSSAASAPVTRMSLSDPDPVERSMIVPRRTTLRLGTHASLPGLVNDERATEVRAHAKTLTAERGYRTAFAHPSPYATPAARNRPRLPRAASPSDGWRGLVAASGAILAIALVMAALSSTAIHYFRETFLQPPTAQAGEPATATAPPGTAAALTTAPRVTHSPPAARARAPTQHSPLVQSPPPSSETAAPPPPKPVARPASKEAPPQLPPERHTAPEPPKQADPQLIQSPFEAANPRQVWLVAPVPGERSSEGVH